MGETAETEGPWMAILDHMYGEGDIEVVDWAEAEGFRVRIVEEIAGSIGEDEDDVGYSVEKMVEVYDLLDWECTRDEGTNRRTQRLVLTERGFSVAHDRRLREQRVAHEREQNRRHREVNRSIAILTLGLVLVGIVQAGVTAFVGKGAPLWQVNGLLGVGVACIGIVAAALFRFGSWDS